MRYSRHLVSLRTFGLAFAVVLTPALMQTDEFCNAGDTSLMVLEVEVADQNLIDDFTPEQRVYEVTLPDDVGTVTVRDSTLRFRRPSAPRPSSAPIPRPRVTARTVVQRVACGRQPAFRALHVRRVVTRRRARRAP